MKAIKHDSMRLNNTLNVLSYIRVNGPITKREIQQGTDLSWGAITNITEYLLGREVITESRSTDYSVGRTPNKLDINDTRNFIVGVDINIRGITAVILDLKCRVLKSVKRSIDQNEKDAILELVTQTIHRLLQEFSKDRVNILGIGVAMQGAVDAAQGVSLFSPHFAGWENVRLKDILNAEFGLLVLVEHDPNCMALAEQWQGGEAKSGNMLFIRLSMGIGMSIMINNEIYTGANGSAGEFGHITMNPDGPLCTCGNYGCLEAYSSGRSILRQAREGVKLGRTRSIELSEEDDESSLMAVAQAARDGDAYLRGVFENAGVYLGVGISNLVNILNPDHIILGGELTAYCDLFLDIARETASRKAWKHSQVGLTVSKAGGNAAAIGAAILFLRRIYLGELDMLFQT